MFDKEDDFNIYGNDIAINGISCLNSQTPELYEHPYFKDYFLVSSTLGIGDKITPLFKKGHCGTIANDLVAANLNKITSTGAIPMFFSYYAETNKIREGMDEKFQLALQNKLEQYNCTLLGAKINKQNKEDIARCSIGGFLIGIVKKEKYLDKINIKEDDMIIGLSSSGIHTHGFDVIEKLHNENKLSDELYENSLKESYIYSDTVEKLISKNLIYSAINISEGGLKNSITRAMPYGLCASINTELIPKQEIFTEIESILSKDVAYSTFNMGVGYCVVTSEENCEEVLDITQKYDPFIFGKIRKTITNEEKISHICIR